MESSILQEILHKIEMSFQYALKSIGILDDRKIKFVLKKKKDLKSGDIIIPAGCMKLKKTQETEMLALLTKLLVDENDQKFIRSIATDKFSFLAFFLDRSKIIKAVFNEINQLGPSYGHRKPQGKSMIVHRVTDRFVGASMSLKELRHCLIQGHVVRLLEANGHTVIHHNGMLDLNKLLEMTESQGEIGCDVTETICSELENLSVFNTQFAETIHKLGLNFEKLRTLNLLSVDVTWEANCDGVMERLPSNLTLDLKQIIQDKELFIGKDGYSKNINNVKLIEDGSPTSIFKDVFTQIEVITNAALQKPCCGCLHVVTHNQTYRQQQIHLIRLALFNKEISESQLIVGPVTLKTDKGNLEETAQSFYKARYSQLKEASEMRYGQNINASELARRVQVLTCASVKVDLLGNDAHNELQIDTSVSKKQSDSRLGSFILYNTARLSALINQFEAKVRKGCYPPLPPVDEVDFSLLREEEDWELVFLFIAEFPSLVRQTVEKIFPDDGKCLSIIHTHKVTKFLASFCKCISAHYNRYHIFSGTESHLFPLMFARLHLMKSALQVLLNCLYLLDIEALTEL